MRLLPTTDIITTPIAAAIANPSNIIYLILIL